MAHFIGNLQGNRGKTSRLGSKESGMDATARGWNIGGLISVFYNEDKKIDVIRFILDGGSNGGQSSKVIGEYELREGKFFDRIAQKLIEV